MGRIQKDARNFLLLRYVLIVAAAYLFLFDGESAPTPILLLIAGALLSNVGLSQAEKYLLRPISLGAIVTSDIAWISLGIWYKGNFGNDIFFIYFFVLLLAAVGQNLIIIVSASVLLSVVDLIFFALPVSEGQSIWTSPALIRVPFLFMAALFYGYLAEQVRREKKVAENRLQALREIDLAITSTLDLGAVLRVLLEKIDLFLPYGVSTVRLLNKKTGELEPIVCRNVDEEEWKAAAARRVRFGRIFTDVTVPVDATAAQIVRHAQTEPQSLDAEFIRKHGFVAYLRVPLIAKDELVGVLTFFTKEEREFSNDEVQFLTTLAGQAAIAIHNSRLYEEMKRLADELALSNRVKDEFLSVMSHELRTPVSVVLGYAGMLKEKLMGEINLDQERVLAKILERSRDLLAMIDGILYATSLEIHADKVETGAVNLTEFLNDLRSSYLFRADNRVTLTWNYTSGLPTLRTDASKLRHILTHLINNAIKFTHNGDITVSARYLPETKGLEFSVVDTGIGIPEESLSIIFEKFYQVDSSDRRLYGGVGIGLYIVKRYTELLGGQVEVESTVGEGSVFSIRLPTEQELSEPL